MAVQCVEQSRIIQSISAIVSKYSGELTASAFKWKGPDKRADPSPKSPVPCLEVRDRQRCPPLAVSFYFDQSRTLDATRICIGSKQNGRTYRGLWPISARA
jgi:hypothetical protein